MKKRVNKKAQFYIIAAIVAIAVIFGIAKITNYFATEKGPEEIFDISKEFGIESGKVIEYGTYEEKNTAYLIKEFVEDYTLYSETKLENEAWYFVYGNKETVTSMAFKESGTGTISINIGDTSFDVAITQKSLKQGREIPREQWDEEETTIRFGTTEEEDETEERGEEQKEYKFKLKKGEIFFFLIVEKVGETRRVAGGEEIEVGEEIGTGRHPSGEVPSEQPRLPRTS